MSQHALPCKQSPKRLGGLTRAHSIPLVIEPDEVIGAQSVMGSAWSVSCFMGALLVALCDAAVEKLILSGSALGGVVVASMGIEANYGIDAGTFLISALASATLLWQSRNGTFELRKRKKEASSEQEASLLSNTEDGVVTENEVVDEGELSVCCATMLAMNSQLCFLLFRPFVCLFCS